VTRRSTLDTNRKGREPTRKIDRLAAANGLRVGNAGSASGGAHTAHAGDLLAGESRAARR
jgi:hypothetical protein